MNALDSTFCRNIFLEAGSIPLSDMKGKPLPSGVTMMLDADLARIRAHRNNIHRYRRLLRTKLSELERQFIERRLAEEQSSLDALTAETFPIAIARPQGRQAAGLAAEP
jgi:hypothetical protein